MKQKVFAIYKGDTFIDLGTLSELSIRLGSKETSIRYKATNAYKRKLNKSINGKYENQTIVIQVPDEDDLD
jgi:hypothetical protein